MGTLRLPPEVEAVFGEFRTCEFTTVNRQGQPLTWPTEPFYDAPSGRLIVTSSIAFPVKAYNARHHPQVAVFFSDPMGRRSPSLQRCWFREMPPLANWSTIFPGLTRCSKSLFSASPARAALSATRSLAGCSPSSFSAWQFSCSPVAYWPGLGAT